jgi:diguanylate cyclase (GGDEF)-like protein/PAS domain S-box-containing protein
MSEPLGPCADDPYRVLDGIAAHVAVVAPSGEIVAVNRAWVDFSQRRGMPPAASAGVGANYLGECQAAERRGDLSARTARLGIESVLQGREARFSQEYPCDADGTTHWFVMRVAPLPASDHVVIAHEDITARRQAEDALRASHAQLELRVAERTRQLQQRNGELRDEIAERERNQAQLRQAAKVFDSAAEGILIADAERQIVRVNAAFSRITGYAADEVIGRNPRLLASGRHDDAFYDELWLSLHRAGQWQGEIWNRRKNGDLFPAWESISVNKDAQGQVVDYISVMSDISAVKQAEARLAHLAHHDPLTGLANRLLFAARLEQALERARRHGGGFALLFIDMDNFKYINDSLGHLAGDRYLQAVAGRLSALVREEDTVARLGGDEFAVLVENLAHAQDAGGLAGKLVQALGQGVQVGAHEMASSASIGIGLYPDDATSADALLKSADAAMYRAKAEGRNTWRFYQPELGAQAYQRMTMLASLRHALDRDELRVLYQPVFELASMRCVGVEALLRWQSPAHGLVLPQVFVPLAEESGLIQPIGRWVLQRALQDLAGWRAQGMRAVRMAVNVSWRQFNDPGFVEHLTRMLRSHALGGDALQLDLEITETALQDSPRSVADLQSLRALQVRVMIDDFGTGYSSLSQLIHMPVDGLKIDRMFLRDIATDPHSRAIIHAVVALGRAMGLDLVGEGVETEAQLEFLRREGCHSAQGYLLGMPVTAAELPRLVDASAASSVAPAD